MGILAAFLVLGFFGTATGGVPFGQEDELFVHVNILNPSDDDLDDTTVRGFIYESGSVASSGQFDLEDNSNTGRFIIYEQPDLQPDYYPVRVVLDGEDDAREVKHVWTWIG